LEASTSTATVVTAHDDDPTLNEPPFLVKFQRSAKNYYQRLIMMTSLRDLVRNGLKEFGEKWPEVGGENPEWWGKIEDRDLLIGVHKHGFGKYDPIRLDPALCFYGRVKAVEKEKRRKN